MTINFCNSEILDHLRTKFSLGELYMFCKVSSERYKFVASGSGNPNEDYYDAEWWDEAADRIFDEIRQKYKEIIKINYNGDTEIP